MNTRFYDIRRTVGSFFEILGAARRAAGAINAGRRADPEALRILGIDPEAFNKIRPL